tara:strand:+ start:975 stop:1394 length:420 start_codon:yes stop_codon:yes gene_type:complete
MKGTRFYICKYCFVEFEPKRRRVQKYCSNTCRSKAYHARKSNNKDLVSKNELIPNQEQLPSKTEKMNLAGIGNAAAGSLIADGVKSLFTKEDDKPVTKGEFKKLIESLGYRYLPIKNRLPNAYGKLPYYDIMTNEIVFI